MSIEKFEETPRIAIFRIFGATAALLLAMLLIVHPQSMYAPMSAVMALIR